MLGHIKSQRGKISAPPLVRLHKKNHLILSDLAAPLLLCKSLCWMKIPIEKKKKEFLLIIINRGGSKEEKE